ncbi:hypothetical protein BS50DRAFT_629381 [Corynespora cassiicola Philippines]|uniref:Rhodopsin domain-containing protein n=1 Tax=Corynespora cassiicola Philippines TaxID=1448308 RepID=A0A2T2P6Q0_CORCC|nr:hypothetical protein BS50DRAFT_629381 [Corynespora cassiicola Philippines]
MGAATSKDMAVAVLMPLPFDVVSTVLRFWIRSQRKAWGSDDWAMLVNVPFWIIATVGLIGMSFSGVGAPDASLSAQEMADSLMWFYVFQEFWCFTLISIKWSIGFTLLRIANGQRWIEVVIYTCLAMVTLSMGGTGMYLFFQCMPVEKNWHTAIEGSCQPREIQTALSFVVAAVSITTDWIFAILPAFLLWDVQMDPRVKLSVVGLLGLGVFASIAPIVRLKFLIGMNDQTKFIENLGPILAWAAAEMNVGMLIANLPACRPLLEKMLSRLSSFTGSRGKSAQYAGNSAPKHYYELDEPDHKKKLNTKQSGMETRIYGRDLEDNSSESLPDDHSQRRIVSQANPPQPLSPSLGAIRVQREFGMEVADKDKKGDAMV